MIVVERAAEADFTAIAALLESNQLTTAGLADCLSHAIVARENDRIVGCAALEVYPTGVLLRSVAVDERRRGHGVGQRLTEAALTLARQRGAPAAYLLTTTAAGFFPRFGFAATSRDDVPEDVRASVEFTSACPASALVMRADLGVSESAR